MVNTPLTYNKISQGITGENRPFKADSMHALESRTQPLLFSKSRDDDNDSDKERAEWDWIKRK